MEYHNSQPPTTSRAHIFSFESPMSPMASSLFPFFFCSLFFFSVSASFPLAFNCSLPSSLSTTPDYNTSLKALLHNLTTLVSTARAVSATSPFVTGFLQCRPHLSSSACARCAQAATGSLQSLCPASAAAAAWFDGCYLRYYHSHDLSPDSTLLHLFLSRPNCTDFTNRRLFGPALSALILHLRAEVVLPSHHRFSAGEAWYGDGRKVFGLVECLQSLTPQECDFCVERISTRVLQSCAGAGGGTVVGGSCLVRFETYQFFTGDSDDGSNNGNGDEIGLEERNDGGEGKEGKPDGGVRVKEKRVWIWWWVSFGGAVCFVFGCWIMRRRIVYSAKVGSLPSDINEEIK